MISSITNNGSTITATKGITALTSHQSISHLLKIDGSNGTQMGITTLLKKLVLGSANATDNTLFVTSDIGGDGDESVSYVKRPATQL